MKNFWSTTTRSTPLSLKTLLGSLTHSCHQVVPAHSTTALNLKTSSSSSRSQLSSAILNNTSSSSSIGSRARQESSQTIWQLKIGKTHDWESWRTSQGILLIVQKITGKAVRPSRCRWRTTITIIMTLLTTTTQSSAQLTLVPRNSNVTRTKKAITVLFSYKRINSSKKVTMPAIRGVQAGAKMSQPTQKETMMICCSLKLRALSEITQTLYLLKGAKTPSSSSPKSTIMSSRRGLPILRISWAKSRTLLTVKLKPHSMLSITLLSLRSSQCLTKSMLKPRWFRLCTIVMTASSRTFYIKIKRIEIRTIYCQGVLQQFLPNNA